MKKGLALLLIMCLILTGCAGKGKEKVPEEKDNTQGSQSESGNGATDASDLPDIEFSIFLPYADFKIPPQDAPVLQQVYEKTHVRIKWVIPPADPAERLNVMLASDDMPDLILFEDEAIMQQYKEAGKLLKLNELLEKYAPNTFNINWTDVKHKVADSNGDYYFLPNSYTLGGGVGTETGNGFNVRTDYFEAEGYDKAPKTLDEFADLLRTVHAKNPDIIPLGLALGPQGQLSNTLQAGMGAYGLSYSDWLVLNKDKKLVYYTDAEEVKEYLRYLNGLTREGLVDPESPLMSTQMLTQKIVDKQDWAFIGDVWSASIDVSAYEQSVGSNELVVMLNPTKDASLEYGTYAPYVTNLYTAGITLTDKCKDPERFMQFYEYLNSEQGWLDALGIINYDFTGENTVENTEGYDYIMRKDKTNSEGKYYLDPSAWMGESWGDDENWWWNEGVETMNIFSFNSLQMHPDADYVFGDNEDVGMWWDENTTRVNGLLGWTGTNYGTKMKEMGVDVSTFSKLTFEPQWPEYIQKLAIDQLRDGMVPRIIMASSEADFEKEWNSYIAELNKAGLQGVVKKYNELYEQRLKEWGITN